MHRNPNNPLTPVTWARVTDLFEQGNGCRHTPDELIHRGQTGKRLEGRGVVGAELAHPGLTDLLIQGDGLAWLVTIPVHPGQVLQRYQSVRMVRAQCF